jgi:hypothetical protein
VRWLFNLSLVSSFPSILELQEENCEIRFNFITVWQLVFHSGGFEALPSLLRLTRRWKIKDRGKKKGTAKGTATVSRPRVRNGETPTVEWIFR